MIQIILSNANFNLYIKFYPGSYQKCEKSVLSIVFETNNTELISHLLSRKDHNFILIEDKLNMERFF